MEPTALLPFIPGGTDFAKRRELFREFGCKELWANAGYVGRFGISVQSAIE